MEDCSDALLRVKDALSASLLTNKNCGAMITRHDEVSGRLHYQRCSSPSPVQCRKLSQAYGGCGNDDDQMMIEAQNRCDGIGENLGVRRGKVMVESRRENTRWHFLASVRSVSHANHSHPDSHHIHRAIPTATQRPPNGCQKFEHDQWVNVNS